MRKRDKKRYTLGRVWNCMTQRCLNPNNPSFNSYGGRGITVCREWLTFQNFYDWSIRYGYRKGLSIERIDNNKGYFPTNCKWATRLEQANNTRTNLNIEFDGKTQTLSQWARELRIDKGTLAYRIKVGWELDRVFKTKPLHEFKFVTFRGRTQTLREWSVELGFNLTTLFMRLSKYKWSTEKAFTTPVRGS